MQTDMLLTTESVAPFFVTSFEHPLYKPFLDLYSESFPLFEQRTAEQQLRAFKATHTSFWFLPSAILSLVSLPIGSLMTIATWSISLSTRPCEERG